MAVRIGVSPNLKERKRVKEGERERERVSKREREREIEKMITHNYLHYSIIYGLCNVYRSYTQFVCQKLHVRSFHNYITSFSLDAEEKKILPKGTICPICRPKK